MAALFPEIKPFHHEFVKVSDRHSIYVERVGSEQGLPVVFLHGGPGGGISPFYRRYFDPNKWHAVLFDQRGCGQSQPFADLNENTTWDLVADIEKLRERYGIEKWWVFGGSWGSTLALAYAQTHPDRCLGLLLRGIFLCRAHELQWFYQEGTSRLFPDFWEQYLRPIPVSERGDLVQAYHRRLTSADAALRLEAAQSMEYLGGCDQSANT
jgi:proline iminopeptidase